MKQNRLDRITDGVLERVGRIRGEVQSQYKNTNPYRMEKVSPEEQIKNYLSMTPEMETQFRQQMGDEAMGEYTNKMNELIMRRQENARLT